MSHTINSVIREKAKRKYLVNLLGDFCSVCNQKKKLYDFHHLDRKSKDFQIGNNDFRLSDLLKEANKCSLVCKNCHREIHDPYDENKLTQKHKIKLQMLEYKNTNCCSKCGYSGNINVLDFHHVDPSAKSFNIGNATISLKGLIVDAKITENVKKELDKCIVLCSQCHAEEHYDFSFDEQYSKEIEYHSKNIREIQPKIDRELVKNMFIGGKRLIDISRELKASKGTICDILKSFGLTTSIKVIKEKSIQKKIIKKAIVIENKEKRRKFNPTLEEAIELTNNMSCRKIGIMYGISHVAVYNRCIKLGINFKNK